MTVLAGSFKNTRDKKTLESLKTSADAWEAESRAQDLKIKNLEDENAEKDRKIADLTSRLDVLQDLVTGRSAIEDLTRIVEQFSQASVMRVGEIMSAIESAQAGVATVNASVDGLRDDLARRATRPPGTKRSTTPGGSGGSSGSI